MAQVLNGANFVVAVSAQPVDGIPLTQMDLKLVWFTGTPPKIKDGELVLTPRCQVTTSDEMVKVDDNTYLALIDSAKTGVGGIMCHAYAKFVDTNWEDERKEYIRIDTELKTV